jgi:hypothetical protein
VAISGDTLVVADSYASRTGAVAYVFVKPAGGWTNALPVASLTISAQGPESDGSAAISGDTIVLGGGYIYVKPAGGWKDMGPTAALKASDGTPLQTVVISGDTIVATNSYAHSFTGAAFVYVKPAAGWKDMTETARLSASDGQTGDYFGSSAAIDGNTIALGASRPLGVGKAYVFVRPVSGWADITQTAELSASDAAKHLEFGSSISVSGDEVLVGATRYNKPGGAYMFVKPTGGWINATETARLFPVDPNEYARYGTSVSVSGDLAVVGAPYFTHGKFYSEGAVFAFSKPAGGWKDMSSATVITGSDAKRGSMFGSAIALSDKSLLVGAPQLLFHSAYLFELP